MLYSYLHQKERILLEFIYEQLFIIIKYKNIYYYWLYPNDNIAFLYF